MRRTLITILTVMMVLSGTLTAVAGDRSGGKHRNDRGVVAAETQKGKDGKRGAREPKTLETGVLTERAGEPDPVGSRLYNVTFRNVDDAKAAADKLAEEYDLKPTHVYRNLFKGMAAKMSPETARKLAKDGRVKSMEQARKIKLDAQTMPTGINRIDADQNPDAAIDGTDTRVDVDVMVIDELAAIHNDLNVVSRGDCVDGSVSGNETGIGHGTHVSGTIAALDNGIGVVGVAPGARIWSVNVFDSQGYGYDSYIACAL
ncbi:MAG: S8 family serine peptidase, partial [Chloroflexota bacterium]